MPIILETRKSLFDLVEMSKYTADNWPADLWPNFSFAEMACQETGECNMDMQFMGLLQSLRNEVGRPMKITSGYRSPRHSIEAAKEAPGTHAMGRAVDIACAGEEAMDILEGALWLGFTGVGVAQKGKNRFLHLDNLDSGEHTANRPAIWSY